MTPRSRLRGLIALAALGALLIVPAIVDAQDAAGFDGYVQSGTCAAPTDDLRVSLESDGPHDVEPYVAKLEGGDDTVVLGYLGSPGLPGFGVSAIYTDQDFSLVISDTDSDDPVACGDLLEPDNDKFGEAGLAFAQLLPVGESGVEGVAEIQRAKPQREQDVTPTRVRIVLSTGDSASTPAQPVAGYDGYIQGGSCETPSARLRVNLKSRDDQDISPYLAKPDSGEAVTLAYYGAPGAPGFGLAAAYTDQDFSVVIADVDGGDPVACGNILEPDDDKFTEAGVALVQLLPVADSGVQGYAVIERIKLQRELDVTPTRVRIVLFAPPVTGE